MDMSTSGVVGARLTQVVGDVISPAVADDLADLKATLVFDDAQVQARAMDAQVTDATAQLDVSIADDVPAFAPNGVLNQFPAGATHAATVDAIMAKLRATIEQQAVQGAMQAESSAALQSGQGTAASIERLGVANIRP